MIMLCVAYLRTCFAPQLTGFIKEVLIKDRKKAFSNIISSSIKLSPNKISCASRPDCHTTSQLKTLSAYRNGFKTLKSQIKRILKVDNKYYYELRFSIGEWLTLNKQLNNLYNTAASLYMSLPGETDSCKQMFDSQQ